MDHIKKLGFILLAGCISFVAFGLLMVGLSFLIDIFREQNMLEARLFTDSFLKPIALVLFGCWFWLSATGAATSYPSAIYQISEHYSQNTDSNIDIYSTTDQNLISQILHDYSQTGRFSDFGYEQHGRYRAAISRYSEFFVQQSYETNSDENFENIEEISNQEQETSPTNFAYERDLQTTLCSQISELFPGYNIFGESNEGIEYSIDRKRIDVLLEHISSGDLLAVELKSGVADFRVFGQISMYLGLLQREFPNKSISGVIVAGTIDQSLQYACLTSDKIKLKIYRMSIELEDV